MAEPLWTLGAICKATGGASSAPMATEISGISIDSRTLSPQEAFIAIRGPNRDGHGFVAAALEKGAALAIVDQQFPATGEERLLRVEDSMQALNDLGRASRARAEGATIIAVTGSAGKTGTKEALRLALVPSGSVHASTKSYNNHWGVPLSLANMRAETRFGVFEAGMNHAGELAVLSPLIRPHLAIITTVEPVHLGFFASVEAIADAKAEIFEGLEPDGTAILNRDNPQYQRLARHALEHCGRVVSFGEAKHADARLVHADLGAHGSGVSADILGERVDYRIGAPGRHLVQNSLAVLATAKLAGADLRLAASALADWRAEAGRGGRISIATKDGPIAIVDETYNANPASMRAALATLGLTPRSQHPRRVAVLGDMLELGEEGPSLHTGLAAQIDAAGVDVVFACGELMAGLYQALPAGRQGAYAKTAEELAPALIGGVAPGDVVMIKGSFGSRMAPLVEALKRHFDKAAPNA